MSDYDILLILILFLSFCVFFCCWFNRLRTRIDEAQKALDKENQICHCCKQRINKF